jgi:sec-independent protein translocase protein TatA
MGGISIWQLVIVLVIVMLLFGTKKLRNMGADLGGAVKGFKKAVTDEEKNQLEKDAGDIIDAKVEKAEEEKPKS